MRLSLLKPRVALMTQFADVQGAAQLSVAVERGQFSDAAYLYLKARTAASGTLVNRVQQRVTHRIVIAHWNRVLSDASGDAAVDAASDVSDALIAHLLGWTPSDRYAPLEYVSGTVLRFIPTVGLLWADEFTTSYLIRDQPSP